MARGRAAIGQTTAADVTRIGCSLVGGGGTAAFMNRGVRRAMATAQTQGAVGVLPSIAQTEARALATAKSLGINVGNRATVLRMIDDEVAEFARQGRSYHNGYGAGSAYIDRVMARIMEGFESTHEIGSRLYRQDLQAHRLRRLQEMRARADSDVIQIIRQNIDEHGWGDFYSAWYHRTVTEGAETLVGGSQTNLAFIPGPTPGTVQVYGYSWLDDPVAALNGQASRPFNVSDVVVQQARRNEGVSAYPLRFNAIISE